MKIDAALHKDLRNVFKTLETQRSQWTQLWLELSKLYMPKRYSSLYKKGESNRRASLRNSSILDSTGTLASRTLAAGMMNGITSPVRQWFRLRLAGFEDELEHPSRVWLDEVERRMLRVMSESNFYKALAVAYLELGVFATSCILIYEDFDDIIRCYNSPLGEFMLAQSASQRVDTFARSIEYKLRQMVEKWGEDNLNTNSKRAWAGEKGGGQLTDHTVHHMVLPAEFDSRLARLSNYPFVELYWEADSNDGEILGVEGFNEFPGIAPRWDTVGNDVYGSTCPGHGCSCRRHPTPA